MAVVSSVLTSRGVFPWKNSSKPQEDQLKSSGVTWRIFGSKSSGNLSKALGSEGPNSLSPTSSAANTPHHHKRQGSSASEKQFEDLVASSIALIQHDRRPLPHTRCLLAWPDVDAPRRHQLSHLVPGQLPVLLLLSRRAHRPARASAQPCCRATHHGPPQPFRGAHRKCLLHAPPLSSPAAASATRPASADVSSAREGSRAPLIPARLIFMNCEPHHILHTQTQILLNAHVVRRCAGVRPPKMAGSEQSTSRAAAAPPPAPPPGPADRRAP
ncbi:unnamed protein product [Plutella xylostella]|uniref:(diamondback moth) hypothetical protein n=1 Tax=Plutella xylostella TaxID=51655 RepID=A0A8S4D0B8_PLUXY|nr:unnamed protein product [Plutella xylostella]